VRGADVVCAATHALEPVIRREWLAPGTHVTSVGYNPDGRELDAATVADALVVVEARATALAPPPAGANDLAGVEVHAEIGELVAGTRPGRTSPEQITVYKSVGVAVQDTAAAALVLARARAAGAGTRVGL
jgi:alanine dehydrogenase